VSALRRAVDTNADHGIARLTLGKALLGSRDLPGAAVQAERAVALIPHDADAHSLLGRVHAVQGRLEQAARDFERAIQIQPRHGEARELLQRVVAAMQPRVHAASSGRGPQ